MPIEFDTDHGFPPARQKELPVVDVRELLAVDEVYLNLGEATEGAMTQFYVKVLGMTRVVGEELRFKFGKRYITIKPVGERVEFVQVGFTVNQFGAMLKGLTEEKIGYELLHIDTGLNRAAIIQDPAGNWIHLLETRPI